MKAQARILVEQGLHGLLRAQAMENVDVVHVFGHPYPPLACMLAYSKCFSYPHHVLESMVGWCKQGVLQLVRCTMVLALVGPNVAMVGMWLVYFIIMCHLVAVGVACLHNSIHAN